ASRVEFDPAPATTGTRPSACSTHHSTTCLCSSCESVGLSPVVPTGTSPLVPSLICQSTRSRNAFSSTAPLRKGVTRAVNDPRTCVLAVRLRPPDAGPARVSGQRIAWTRAKKVKSPHDPPPRRRRARLVIRNDPNGLRSLWALFCLAFAAVRPHGQKKGI